MTRHATKMFGIDTIDDYLVLCAEAVAQLQQDEDNVLSAFAAILALNHIPDWLQHKLTEAQRGALGLAGSNVGDAVKDHFERQNPDLKRVRDIANGFKHLKPVHPTEKISGYGSGPYGVGPFGAPYLLIDLGEDMHVSERWDVGFDLCRRVLEWWRAELSKLDYPPGETKNV